MSENDINEKEQAVVKKKAPTAVKPRAAKKVASSRVLAAIGTGRRKTSVAAVNLVKGTGKINVNSKPFEEYFVGRQVLISTVLNPLQALNLVNAFDINVQVKGGGIASQADAVRMGIARALVEFDSELRKSLRPLDLLKRDPRMKERKKYGLKRARRAFQYTKR